MSKILVIEDEDAVRENIIELLNEEGYEVVGAGDGEEGVVQIWTQIPDLIICDILMPKLDGYGVLAKINQDVRLTSIPFLFLTAKIGRDDLRRGMGLGADDYITKPFTRSELLQAISVRLGKMQKLESIAQKKIIDLQKNLAGNFPHELLTPLSVTLGYSEILDQNSENLSKEEIRLISQDIHRSALHLLRMVQNYLLYSELDAIIADGKKGERYLRAGGIAAVPVIKGIAEEKAHQVGRLMDLTVELQNVELSIFEAHLMKIVEEIVENSLKYSRKGTPLCIEGELFPGKRVYRLRFTDEGRGMTPEQIRGLDGFDPFDWQLREQKGLGLGLAKRLASFYGGSLKISSQIAKGTVIDVLLPVRASSG